MITFINETNKRKSTCIATNCTCVLERGEGHGVFIPNLGQRYVCDNHYSNMLGWEQRYHSNANNGFTIEGTSKRGFLTNITVGCELEVYDNDSDSNKIKAIRGYMEANNVHAESDCTVTLEFVLQPQRGLAKISKLLGDIENSDLLSLFNNEEVGAHVHISNSNMSYCKRFYHSLFVGLSDYICNLPADNRIKVFGRDINRWSCPINDRSDVTNHANIFNMQHSNTIEFRLPRITNKRQYLNVIKFWRECGAIIEKYFIAGFIDERTSEAIAHNKDNAKKACDLMIKACEKMVSKSLNNCDYVVSNCKYE